MASELDFNEENMNYQLPFNGSNHLLEHNILQGGTNRPRHMAELSGLRRAASWGPYQHTGMAPTTEDWSSNSGTLSQMGSRSASHFSVDPYQRGMYQELEEARKKNIILEAQLETMTKAFLAVVGAVPSLLAVANPLGQSIPLSTQGHGLGGLGGNEHKVKPPCQDDYPEIKFWYEDNWKTYCKQMKASSTDRGIVSDYMESEDGHAVSAGRAREIREVAFMLWYEILDKGRAPAKWSEAAADVRNFYRAGMEEKCPEMRYCHNGWKAHHLATKNYSSFYSNHGHKSRHSAIKQEQVDCKNISPDAKPQKRSLSDGKEEDVDKGPGVKRTKRTHQDKPVVPTTTSIESRDNDLILAQSTDQTEHSNNENKALNQAETPTDNVARLAQPTASATATATNVPPRPVTIARILFSSGEMSESTSATSSDPPPTSGASGVSLNLTSESTQPTSTTSTLPTTSTNGAQVDAAATALATSEADLITRATSPGPSHVPLHTPDITTAPTALPSASEAGKQAQELNPPTEQSTPVAAVTSLKNTRAEPITARNICKREWATAHPNGLSSEFTVYWASIKGSADEARFQRQAQEDRQAANSNKRPKTRRSKAV